ncbi:RNA polymerase sigma factor [Actinoplanes ianthinogenes]|uniref:RNA polymerase sigma factor n=1 Tax=Actinoplanes ianthinogenes TaxID=122358 RepID=UPI001671127E|nr:sigma-70 family RNA polymerase sigma factor [Actinoplanes ianthinogenes]
MPAPEEHFTRLWRDHAPAVLRYARRRVDDEQADEVVAETFVVAWRRLAEIPAAELPWLFGVARRVSANIRRSDQRRHALHDRMAEQARLLAQAEPRRATPVLAALAVLPDDDRELLMLLAWDGLTRHEAAVALGCSRGTLAVRLHRARRRLKAAMTLADPEPPTVDHRPAVVAPGGAR